MKKELCLIFLFFLFLPELTFSNEVNDGYRHFYLALGPSYQWKNDDTYKTVYPNGALDLTCDIGYLLTPHISLGVKISHQSQKGLTSLLKKETSLVQIPVTSYLRAVIGGKLKGYVSMGAGFLFFKEESYIGQIKSKVFGWELETGLEFSLSETFYLLTGLRHLSFKKNFQELGETQKLGGTGIRLGLGLRL